MRPFAAETDIFIRPGYGASAPPTRLLTNFHLPRSTLLMLVAAFSRTGQPECGAPTPTRSTPGYRFYSYGDAGLWFRRQPRPRA